MQQHITEPLFRLRQIQSLSTLASSPNAKVIFLGNSAGKAAPTTLFDVR